MKKKLIFAVIILAALLALLAGYLAWSSRNTAKAEAERVLEGSTAITWYCENGSGKGTDNQNPWWEKIYVSNASAEETAQNVGKQLKDKGYSITSEYIENSQDPYNTGKTYWEIQGERSGYSAEARVSSKTLTLNNCFTGSSNMDEGINPENYNSVIVIKFRAKP